MTGAFFLCNEQCFIRSFRHLNTRNFKDLISTRLLKLVKADIYPLFSMCLALHRVSTLCNLSNFTLQLYTNITIPIMCMKKLTG